MTEIRDRLRACAVEAGRLASLISDASEASLFNKMAALEACRNNPFQPAQVWHPTEYGNFLELDLREQVSREIYLTGAFEPDLLWFFACVVDDAAQVIDGGAHLGYFSIALGRLVGPAGRVDAFEPVSDTKRRLDTNVRNAGMAQIKTHGLALWSKPTVLALHDWGVELSAYNGVGAPRVSPGTPLPEAKLIRVGATSLDEFVQSAALTPSLVKLDVENAEGQVIQGMQKLLTEGRPIVVVEVGDFAPSLDAAQHMIIPSCQMLQNLSEAAYKLFEVRNCRLSAHGIVLDRPYDYGNIIAIPEEAVQSVLARTGSAT